MFLLKNNRKISNGIPNSEVIALIGRIVGCRIVFEKMSAITNKQEPIKVEDNNNSFGDSSFNSRAIWGATSPINPIIPTIETVLDARSEQITRNNTLSKFTLTPYITAFLSPCWIKPKSFENRIDTKSEHPRIIARTREFLREAFVKAPVVQKVI